MIRKTNFICYLYINNNNTKNTKKMASITDQSTIELHTDESKILKGQTEYTIAPNVFNASYAKAIPAKQIKRYYADDIKPPKRTAIMEKKYSEDDKLAISELVKRQLTSTATNVETGDVEGYAFSHCVERTYDRFVNETTKKKHLFVDMTFPKMYRRFQNEKISNQIYQMADAAKKVADTERSVSRKAGESQYFDISTVEALNEEKKALKKKMERYQDILQKFTGSPVFIDDGKYDFASTVNSLAEEIATNYSSIKAKMNSIAKKLNVETDKELINSPQDALFFVDGLMRDLNTSNPTTKLMQLMALPQYSEQIKTDMQECNREIMIKLSQIAYASQRIEQLKLDEKTRITGGVKRSTVLEVVSISLSFIAALMMKVYDQSFVHTMMFESSSFINTAFVFGMPIIMFNASEWGQMCGAWVYSISTKLGMAAITATVGYAAVGATFVSSYLAQIPLAASVLGYVSQFTMIPGIGIYTIGVTSGLDVTAGLYSYLVNSESLNVPISSFIVSAGMWALTTGFNMLDTLKQIIMGMEISYLNISGSTVNEVLSNMKVVSTGVSLNGISEMFTNMTIVYVCLKSMIDLFSREYKSNIIESDEARTGYVITSKPILALVNFMKSDNFSKAFGLGVVTFAGKAFSKYMHGTSNFQISRVLSKANVPYYDAGSASYQLFLIESYYVISYIVSNNILRPYFERVIASNKTMMDYLFSRTETGADVSDVFKMSLVNLILTLVGEQTLPDLAYTQAKIIKTWAFDSNSYEIADMLAGKRRITPYNVLSAFGKGIASTMAESVQDISSLYMQWYLLSRGSQASTNVFSFLAASKTAREEFAPTTSDFLIMPLYLQTLTTHLTRMLNPWNNLWSMRDYALLGAIDYASKGLEATDFSAQKMAMFYAIYVMLKLVSNVFYSRETYKSLGISAIKDWEIYKAFAFRAKSERKQKLSRQRTVWERVKQNKYKIGTLAVGALALGASAYLSIDQANSSLVAEQVQIAESGLNFYKSNEEIYSARLRGEYTDALQTQMLQMSKDDPQISQVILGSLYLPPVNYTEQNKDTAPVTVAWTSSGLFGKNITKTRECEMQIFQNQNTTSAQKAIELYETFPPFVGVHSSKYQPLEVAHMRAFIADKKKKNTWVDMQFEDRFYSLIDHVVRGGDKLKTYRYLGYIRKAFLLNPPKVTDVDEGDDFLISMVQKTAFMISYEELDFDMIRDFFKTQLTIVDFSNSPNLSDHITHKMPGFDLSLTSLPHWSYSQLTSVPYNSYKSQIPMIQDMIRMGERVISYFQKNILVQEEEVVLRPQSILNTTDAMVQELWMLGDQMARNAEEETPNDYNVVVNTMRFFLNGNFRTPKDFLAGESVHQAQLSKKLENILEESLYQLSATLGDYFVNDEIMKLLNPSIVTMMSESVEIKKFNRVLFTLAMINDYKTMSRLHYNQPVFRDVNAGFKEMEFHLRALKPENLMSWAEKLFHQNAYDNEYFHSHYKFLNKVAKERALYREFKQIEAEYDVEYKKLTYLVTEAELVENALAVKPSEQRSQAVVVKEFLKGYKTEVTPVATTVGEVIENFQGHQLAVAVINDHCRLTSDIVEILGDYQTQLTRATDKLGATSYKLKNELDKHETFYTGLTRTKESRIAQNPSTDPRSYDVNYERLQKIEEIERTAASIKQAQQNQYEEKLSLNKMWVDFLRDEATRIQQQQKVEHEKFQTELTSSLSKLVISEEDKTRLALQNQQIEALQKSLQTEITLFDDAYEKKTEITSKMVARLFNPEYAVTEKDIEEFETLINEKESLVRKFFDTADTIQNDLTTAKEFLPALLTEIESAANFTETIELYNKQMKYLTNKQEIEEISNKIEKVKKQQQGNNKFFDQYKVVIQTNLQQQNPYAEANKYESAYGDDKKNLDDIKVKREKHVKTEQEAKEKAEKNEKAEELIRKQKASTEAKITAKMSWSEWVGSFVPSVPKISLFSTTEQEVPEDFDAQSRAEAATDKNESENINHEAPANINNVFWPISLTAGAAYLGLLGFRAIKKRFALRLTPEQKDILNKQQYDRLADITTGYGDEIIDDENFIDLIISDIINDNGSDDDIHARYFKFQQERRGIKEEEKHAEEEEEEEEEEEVKSPKAKKSFTFGRVKARRGIREEEEEQEEPKSPKTKKRFTFGRLKARLTNVTISRYIRKEQAANYENGHHSWSETRNLWRSMVKKLHRLRMESFALANKVALDKATKYPLGDPLILYYTYMNTAWIQEETSSMLYNLIDEDTIESLQILLVSVFRHHEGVNTDKKLAKASQLTLLNLDYARQLYPKFNVDDPELHDVNFLSKEWMLPLTSMYDAYLNDRIDLLLLNNRMSLTRTSEVITKAELEEMKTYHIGELEVLVDHRNYNDYLTLKFILEKGSTKSSHLINNGDLIITHQAAIMSK